LSSEYEIKLAVMNRSGAEAKAPFTQPARSAGESQHPNAAKAAEAEAKILELLKARPMRMTEIAAEMKARQTTTSERLRRLLVDLTVEAKAVVLKKLEALLAMEAATHEPQQ
jgi:hypothetical protein